MNSINKFDENRLLIFHEGRKRRIFVGELIYNKKNDQYEFIYDKEYAHSKKAVPIGADLDLFKVRHISQKGKLFASFQDRIPLMSNPAYEDYCKSQGISIKERNPIILLGSIGKRGPSSFVFEPVYEKTFSYLDILKLREELNITQHDLAKAFDINRITLLKIETGKSQDFNTLKRLQIYFEFPEVALWQLKQTGGRVHSNVLSKLIRYLESKRNHS